MDAAILLLGVFGIFIPALLLPGPDFVAVVRSSMSHGTSMGLMTAIGVSFGLMFYASLSLLGLSAILIQFQWLAVLIRVLGGAYLIYLGVRLLTSKPPPVDIGQTVQAPRKPLLLGFLVTLCNPKAVVLFTSVFATAVTSQTPLWLMLTMIALVGGSALAWYATVSLFMSSKRVITRFEHAQHWIERAAGVCFVGIGGRILADSKNPIHP